MKTKYKQEPDKTPKSSDPMKWVKKSLILITLSIIGIFYAQAEPPHFEEVERIKLEVMDPCWEEYKRDEGYSSVRERSENLLDCLLSQSRKNRKVTNKGRSQTDRQSQTARKAGSQTDRQRVPHCSIDCDSGHDQVDLEHLPDWDAEPQWSASTALSDWNTEPQEHLSTAGTDEAVDPNFGHISNDSTVHQHPFPYHKDLRVQLHIVDDEYSGEIEFDAVLPISGSKDRALFAQPGFILSIKNPSDGQPAYEHNHLLSANFGLVYRFTFHKGILGLNIFYDRQWDLDHLGLHHDRLSLGVDYQSGRNILAFNQYLPLEDWKTIDEFYEERAVGGWDFIFKRLFTPKVEGTAKISYYDYAEPEKDRFISSIGVDYKINCQSQIGFAIDQDFSTDEVSGTLQYQRQLGLTEEQKQANCLQTQYEAKGKGQLFRPVQREKRIRLQHKRKVPVLSIPDQYTETGRFFSYSISRANYQSVKPDETPGIFITSKPDWLFYDKVLKKFSGTAPLTPKVETVRGNIFLPDNTLTKLLKSAFSFQIVVRSRSLPRLTVPDSTVPINTVTVVYPENPVDERCEVMVHPGPPNGPVVTYLSHRDGFSIHCRQSHVDCWTITGTLECEDEGISHTSNFAFKVTCQPPAENPPAENPPTENPPTENPPTENPPTENPPTENPPAENPPAENPIETDNSAPVLRAMNQVVHYGDTVYQTPVISNLRLNEPFTVTVSEKGTGGLFVSYDSTNNRFVTNASNATERESVIIGTIQDENNNFSRWAFRVTVVFPTEEPPNEQEPEPDPIVDNQAPRLLAQDQTVRQGNSLHYAPLIDQLSLNESWTVTVGSLATDAPTVTWDADNDRFVINAEGSAVAVKEHTVSGTIEDESNNSSTWSFKVTVTQAPVTLDPPRDPEVQTPPANPPVDPGDTTPPLLEAQNQQLKKGTSLNYAPRIRNLRDGEGYTVTVDSLPADAPAVNWDSTNRRFVINAEGNAVAIKEHTVSGTIGDESNNLSRWTFKVNVFDILVLTRPQDPPDTIAPTLTAEDQSLRKGTRLNYAPTIGSVRNGEGYTVTVSAVPNNAPTVTWDSTNSRFAINATSASLGQYNISGTIQDASNNSSTWSFKVTVTQAPVTLDPPRDPEVQTPPANPPVDPGDTTPPLLEAQNQQLKKGTSLNYAPRIRNLRDGEGYTVTVDSLPADAPTVTWDSTNNRFIINAEGSAVAIKEHSISGTIEDESSNSSSWSFTVTVTAEQVQNPQPDPPQPDPPTDTTAPTLTAGNQTVEIGQSTTHAPTIGSVRNGEGYTVTVSAVPNNAPTVTWDSTNSRFAINATSASLGQYNISGTIQDASNNSSSWSFTVTVADTQAPTLTAQDQSLRKGNRLNYAPTIDNLRNGEGYTVTVGFLATDAPTVTWDTNNARFVIDTESNSVAVKQHSISGTIQDASNNSSSWSFKVTVTANQVQNPQPPPPTDTTAPTLTAENKTVEIGQRTTHTPTIGSVRDGEGYTVTVHTLSNNAPSVTWDSTNKRFAINATSAGLGRYTVSGTIKDENNNSNLWSFIVTVDDTQAPTLRMSDLTIEQSESITISPGIGNVRTGESWTVTVGSLTPTALVDEPSVSWNSQAKKFSIRGGDTPGTYTVRGTIQDASSNSNSWSFRIIVRSPAIPTLTAQNQRVKTQKKVRHTPTITGVLSHQSFTVAISSVTPSNDATPRVSWDSENSRFVIRTGGKTGGPYTVRGRITKGVNYSNWSFTITVE